MEAQITSFRRSRRVTRPNQMILKVIEINNKDAAQEIIGKTVSWRSSSGKEIKGQIINTHGNNGCVKARFEKGMPGQSLFKKVEIKYARTNGL